MEILFATLAVLIVQAPITTEYISKMISTKTGKEIVGSSAFILSWLVGIGSTIFAAYTDSTLFGLWPFAVWWQQGLFYGAIVSACANGLFQLESVKKFLVLIKARS